VHPSSFALTSSVTIEALPASMPDWDAHYFEDDPYVAAGGPHRDHQGVIAIIVSLIILDLLAMKLNCRL